MDQEGLKENLIRKQSRHQSLIFPTLSNKKQGNHFYGEIEEQSSVSHLQFQQCEEIDDQRLYQSCLQKPRTHFQKIKEQVRKKSMILLENYEQNQFMQPNRSDSIDSFDNIDYSNRNLSRKTTNYTSLKLKSHYQNIQKKKTLNMRIFNLNKRTLHFLYYFNLLFNIIFRLGVLLLLSFLVFKKITQIWLIGVVVGLEGITILLYMIAIHKLLYTKSSQIGIFFQKQFYPEKHYDEINLDRIMRKHFTAENMCRNVNRFINPFTSFRKNIKISVMRQQIYKRMEIVLVVLPLLIIQIVNVKWFDFDENDYVSQSLIGIVFCCEIVRLVFHYLIIYISS